MNHLSRSFSAALIIMAAPVAVSACSSDDDAASTTEVVVAGAPLSVSGPRIVAGSDGDTIVGTIENVTDRTIEITSAQSSAGEVEFRSTDGSLLASVKIEPDSDLELAVDGVHLALLEATDDDSVDVVLGLDIQDAFSFTADRVAGE